MRQETVLDFLNQCAAERNRNKDWMVSLLLNYDYVGFR